MGLNISNNYGVTEQDCLEMLDRHINIGNNSVINDETFNTYNTVSVPKISFQSAGAAS